MLGEIPACPAFCWGFVACLVFAAVGGGAAFGAATVASYMLMGAGWNADPSFATSAIYTSLLLLGAVVGCVGGGIYFCILECQRAWDGTRGHRLAVSCTDSSGAQAVSLGEAAAASGGSDGDGGSAVVRRGKVRRIDRCFPLDRRLPAARCTRRRLALPAVLMAAAVLLLWLPAPGRARLLILLWVRRYVYPTRPPPTETAQQTAAAAHKGTKHTTTIKKGGGE